jgi:two-component system sensor histidine kinase SenX3
VEAVRRDFVANVGHELKTPVGALSLLAEAIEDAADDPETVRRFATRMTHEADRLARLVRELIDLSRLQGGEPLPELVPVEVDTVIAEAVDRTKLAASAKQIRIGSGGEADWSCAASSTSWHRGHHTCWPTPSPTARAHPIAWAPARAGFVEITVTDSGIGIPRARTARGVRALLRSTSPRASRTGGTVSGLASSSTWPPTTAAR